MTGPNPTPPPAAVPPVPPAAPVPPVAPAPDLGDRVKAFGEELGTRGQHFGREAQVAGERWSRDPSVVRVATTASQAWGIVLLLVGLYFFVEVTLGYALPAIPWSAVWPVALILVGLVVIARGMTRRS